MGIARGTWNRRGRGCAGAPALARTRRSLLQRPDATSRPESCRDLKKFPAILAASLRGRRISDEKGLIPPGGSLWTFLGIAPTASRRHRRRFTALPEKVWSLLAFCRDLGEEEKHHPSPPGGTGCPKRGSAGPGQGRALPSGFVGLPSALWHVLPRGAQRPHGRRPSGNHA